MEEPSIFDGPEFKCLQCGHAISGECYYGIAASRVKVPAVEEIEVKKVTKRINALEKDKDAMLADYRSMLLTDFFKKWGIHSTLWQVLKVKWDVTGKQRGGYHEAGSGHSEHEEYLVLLGYQQAVREILGRGKE